MHLLSLIITLHATYIQSLSPRHIYSHQHYRPHQTIFSSTAGTRDVDSRSISKKGTLSINQSPALELPSVYSGKSIEQYYDARPFEVWQRLVKIGGPIAGWWYSRKVDKFMSRFRTAAENEAILNERAADLKDSIVAGKSVTFIKSGQALALRGDLLKSAEYVRELTKLQDEVGTFANDLAYSIIDDELGHIAGPNATQRLFDFDFPDPIASASIGQVYRVRLKENNKTCALKVQRPDALESAALDMYILRKLAAYSKKKYKFKSDLVGIADEFGCQLFNELNYKTEASNCVKFKSLYGNIPDIYVPDVYSNLTTQRVLVMEFVEGSKGPWRSGGEKMLTLGLQCSVLQLLETGFFHADPHRGNLLQTPTGQLCYLDFGMMAQVSAQRRYALIGAALGLVNKEIGVVIRNLKTLEFLPPESDTDLIIASLNSAIANSTDNGQGSTLNFTKLNANLMGIQTILPFRLPPFYTLIVRTLTILEGLALDVDPSFKLVKGAYPFIAKQLLGSPAPELQELLVTLIVDESTKRIKWDRLEQFISISSNADKAISGDFNALKSAQNRSDIIKAFNGQQESSNFTYEVSVQIFDFLISERGKFLLDPLIDELVEIIESLGLVAVSLLSISSNGLIPLPGAVPDKARVQQVVQLVKVFLSQERFSSAPSGLSRVLKYLDSLQELISGIGTSSILLSKVNAIVLRVLSRLSERYSRRAVQNIFKSNRMQRALPIFSRVLDSASFPLTSLVKLAVHEDKINK